MAVPNIYYSKGGVCCDLDHSVHTTIVQNTGMEFFFSSEYYMRKFEDKIETETQKLRATMIFQTGFDLINIFLGAVYLYVKIEKRGFRVTYNGTVYRKATDLLFALNENSKLFGVVTDGEET